MLYIHVANWSCTKKFRLYKEMCSKDTKSLKSLSFFLFSHWQETYLLYYLYAETLTRVKQSCIPSRCFIAILFEDYSKTSYFLLTDQNSSSCYIYWQQQTRNARLWVMFAEILVLLKVMNAVCPSCIEPYSCLDKLKGECHKNCTLQLSPHAPQEMTKQQDGSCFL